MSSALDDVLPNDSITSLSIGPTVRHEGHHDAVQNVMRGFREDEERRRCVDNVDGSRILDEEKELA